MEVLRDSPSRIARRVHAAMTAAAPAGGGDATSTFAFLTPNACHELLTAPGAAAALATALNDSAPAMIKMARTIHGALANVGPTVGAVGASMLESMAPSGHTAAEYVLLTATQACRCGDAVIMRTLLDGLPASYGPLAGRLTPHFFHPVSSFFVILNMVALNTLDVPAMDLLADAPRTALCAPIPPYATAWREVVHLGASTLHNRLLVELVTAAASAVAVGRRDTTCYNGPMPLPILCRLRPRQVLDDVPDVFAVFAAALTQVTVPRVVGTDDAAMLINVILDSLLALALVDPPRLRRAPGMADTIAATQAALAAGAPDMAEQLGGTLVDLLLLLSPEPGALAASPAAMGLLVQWTAAPPDSQWVNAADQVGCVALHVGLAHLRGGARRLPGALGSARPTWRRVARGPTAGDGSYAVAAAAALAALAAGTAAADVTVPWVSPVFPEPTIMLFSRGTRRCWTCGSPGKAADIHVEAPHCGACRMAIYCGRACAAVGWRAGGHKAACPGWKRLGDAAVAQYDALIGAEVPGPTARRHHRRWAVMSAKAADTRGPSGRWAWPVADAAEVVAAGLPLTEVLLLADPAMGEKQLVPAAEYAHRPSAVPPAALEEAARRHGEDVIRVVVRAHPPRVLALPVDFD